MFRRRDKRKLILAYIQEHGPCTMREVSKGTRINPGTASWLLATEFADGHLTHLRNPDPDAVGAPQYRYNITYAGQLHLERADE
jgi:predicted ArsR family transcriptional regulator